MADKMLSVNLCFHVLTDDDPLPSLYSSHKEKARLCMLRGDSAIKNNVGTGYRLLQLSSATMTALYKEDRVSIRRYEPTIRTSGFMKTLDARTITCFKVTTEEAGMSRMFGLLAWDYDEAFGNDEVTDVTKTEELLKMAQHIAIDTQCPIWLAGDLRQSMLDIQARVEKVNNVMMAQIEEEDVSPSDDEYDCPPNLLRKPEQFLMKLHDFSEGTSSNHDYLISTEELTFTKHCWFDSEKCLRKIHICSSGEIEKENLVKQAGRILFTIGSLLYRIYTDFMFG